MKLTIASTILTSLCFHFTFQASAVKAWEFGSPDPEVAIVNWYRAPSLPDYPVEERAVGYVGSISCDLTRIDRRDNEERGDYEGRTYASTATIITPTFSDPVLREKYRKRNFDIILSVCHGLIDRAFKERKNCRFGVTVKNNETQEEYYEVASLHDDFYCGSRRVSEQRKFGDWAIATIDRRIAPPTGVMELWIQSSVDELHERVEKAGDNPNWTVGMLGPQQNGVFIKPTGRYDCAPVSFSKQGSRGIALERNQFVHNCPTRKGESGSPMVFYKHGVGFNIFGVSSSSRFRLGGPVDGRPFNLYDNPNIGTLLSDRTWIAVERIVKARFGHIPSNAKIPRRKPN